MDSDRSWLGDGISADSGRYSVGAQAKLSLGLWTIMAKRRASAYGMPFRLTIVIVTLSATSGGPTLLSFLYHPGFCVLVDCTRAGSTSSILRLSLDC
jgi:hypothetical protein